MALFVWENLMIDCQAWGYPKGTTIKAMKTEGHECPTWSTIFKVSSYLWDMFQQDIVFLHEWLSGDTLHEINGGFLSHGRLPPNQSKLEHWNVLKPMVTWAIGDPPKNPQNMIFIDFQLSTAPKIKVHQRRGGWFRAGILKAWDTCLDMRSIPLPRVCLKIGSPKFRWLIISVPIVSPFWGTQTSLCWLCIYKLNPIIYLIVSHYIILYISVYQFIPFYPIVSHYVHIE